MGFVGVTTAIYLTIRFGQAEKITPDTAGLLGRPPTTLRLYVGPLNKNMKTTLSREDYASFMVAAAADDGLIGQAPVLSDK